MQRALANFVISIDNLIRLYKNNLLVFSNNLISLVLLILNVKKIYVCNDIFYVIFAHKRT